VDVQEVGLVCWLHLCGSGMA